MNTLGLLCLLFVAITSTVLYLLPPYFNSESNPYGKRQSAVVRWMASKNEFGLKNWTVYMWKTLLAIIVWGLVEPAYILYALIHHIGNPLFGLFAIVMFAVPIIFNILRNKFKHTYRESLTEFYNKKTGEIVDASKVEDQYQIAQDYINPRQSLRKQAVIHYTTGWVTTVFLWYMMVCIIGILH